MRGRYAYGGGPFDNGLVMLTMTKATSSQAATLDDILITRELARRPTHQLDPAAEIRALERLATALMASPSELMQEVAECTLELCRAGTAGMSVLAPGPHDEDVFRWSAVAGVFASRVGITVPGRVSPAGIAMERGDPQLFTRPGRYFDYFRELEPEITELLVVPLPAASSDRAVIWVLSHDPEIEFDAEDARLLRSLAGFVGAGLASLHTQEELERANEYKDELLGLVSHELRTPLTTLAGNANILRRRGDELPKEVRDMALLDIERDAGRLQRIVENMLNLAQPRRHREFEPTLLRHLIERIVAEHMQRFSKPAIHFEVPQELFPVLADEGYVRQIVGNLISNAVKYAGEGEVDIRLGRADVPDQAFVEVSDRGKGISAESLKQITEPFYRSPENSRQASGLGLGLTVCQRLVELQGGTFSVAARPGGGTTFSFTLPIATDGFAPE